MIERTVARPHLADHVEVFAAAPVAVDLGQEVAFAGLIFIRRAGNDVQQQPALRELVGEGRDLLPRGERRRHRARTVSDQELDPLGMIGGVERYAEPFRGRGVVADQHGVITPLLMQAGEIDDPVARNMSLDEVNRDTLHLGADHPEDSGWHEVPLDFQGVPLLSNEPATSGIGKPKVVAARRYFRDGPCGYKLAANNSQLPGRPFSSCAPRWLNFRPAPATRSVTTRETRTS